MANWQLKLWSDAAAWHGLPCGGLDCHSICLTISGASPRRAFRGFPTVSSPPLLSSLPPAAYAKPKQQEQKKKKNRECVIKKRSKNLQNFSVARRAQSGNFHTERDDWAGEGGRRRTKQQWNWKSYTHTQWQQQMRLHIGGFWASAMSFCHSYLDLASTPHPVPHLTTRSWLLQQDKPISMCFKYFANQKPSKSCSCNSLRCHTRVSLALSPAPIGCVWICVDKFA